MTEGNVNGVQNKETNGEDSEDDELKTLFNELKENPKMANAMKQNMSQEELELFHSIENHINGITDDCPTTPKPPPGSLFSDMTRPSSPTGINEFPFEDKGKINIDDYNYFDITHRTTNKLPKFKASKVDLDSIVQDINMADEYIMEDLLDTSKASEVTTYTVVADIGTYGRTFKLHKTEVKEKGSLADSGANCCMTANKELLKNLRKLEAPITIGVAVCDNGPIKSSAECTHVGDLTIKCDNGETVITECFYNPYASDTIISPQAIIDSSDEYTIWKQIGRKFGKPGQLSFIGPESTKTITLQQRDGLYFINSETYQIIDDRDDMVSREMPKCNRLSAYRTETKDDATQTILKNQSKKQAPRQKRYQPASKAKILEAETWYLRMGGCNEKQLDKLTQHATGIPEHFEWHPFRYIDFREQARIRKQPVGRNPQKVSTRGRRFYMDFGFIRASNDDFSKKSNKTDRVVESFDGYSSYLLVVDEVSKYSWIFLTKSKEPPVELTRIFMNEFANEDGGFIRCDQGGELARSTEWRTAMLKEFQYKVEPTGADSPSQKMDKWRDIMN